MDGRGRALSGTGAEMAEVLAPGLSRQMQEQFAVRWHELGIAVALLLVLEGIFPFLNPPGLRRALLALSELNDQQMRFAGLSSMLVGLVLLYIINS